MREFTHDEIERSIRYLERHGFIDQADIIKYLMEEVRKARKAYR